MRKLIFSITTILMLPVIAKAQSTPLYQNDTVQPATFPYIVGGQAPLDGNGPSIIGTQMIYYHSDFKGMPVSGTITDLYIMMNAYPCTPKGATLPQFQVRLGSTSLIGFPAIWGSGSVQKVTAGMTTVYYDSVYTIPDTVCDMQWWRIPLQTPYNYSFATSGDSANNLMVEISARRPKKPFNENITGHFNVYYWYVPTSAPAPYMYFDTSNNYQTAGQYLKMWIGFNPKPDTLTPVGIQSVEMQEEFSVYPSPAQDVINLNKKGNYVVCDLRGVELLKGDASGKPININKLINGIYVVHFIESNGEKHVLRFLKE